MLFLHVCLFHIPLDNGINMWQIKNNNNNEEEKKKKNKSKNLPFLGSTNRCCTQSSCPRLRSDAFPQENLP